MGNRFWLHLAFVKRRRLLLGLALVLLLGCAVYLRWEKGPAPQSVQPQIVAVIPEPHIPKLREIVGSFEPNQTITQALAKQGLPQEVVHQIIDSAAPVYNLAKVKARQLYWLCLTEDGKFLNFRYPVDDERYLTVYHDSSQDCLVPVVKNYNFETKVETVSASIDDSLFASVMSIGEKDQLALEMAEIFGSDIDFNTDIQKGDSFRILVEKRYLDGQFNKYGRIQAASFTNQGKEFTGFLFHDDNGKPAYYGPDGKSLKKSFLKSPLRFGRITSTFSRARLHPVLKIVRPHLGVDYAAASGTPVQAVGDGVVTSAGYSGGGGNTVSLRHASGYETKYMHLSRITVRRGSRVSQGQVIGKVGSTGLSTGPHLDFRVYKSGKAMNPLKVIVPPGAPVRSSEFAAFAAMRDTLKQQLDSELTKQAAR